MVALACHWRAMRASEFIIGADEARRRRRRRRRRRKRTDRTRRADAGRARHESAKPQRPRVEEPLPVVVPSRARLLSRGPFDTRGPLAGRPLASWVFTLFSGDSCRARRRRRGERLNFKRSPLSDVSSLAACNLQPAARRRPLVAAPIGAAPIRRAPSLDWRPLSSGPSFVGLRALVSLRRRRRRRARPAPACWPLPQPNRPDNKQCSSSRPMSRPLAAAFGSLPVAPAARPAPSSGHGHT
jgi:hypothetical protein